jgi:hypothetical protein
VRDAAAHVVRSGRFNIAGELFAPDGTGLAGAMT